MAESESSIPEERGPDTAAESARPDAGVQLAGGPAWIDIFTGVIVNPVATFRQLSLQAEAGAAGLPGAVIAVVLASTVDGFMSAETFTEAPFTIPLSIVGGLIGWLLLLAPVCLIGFCFTAPAAQIRSVIVTTGWAFLPWMFIGPAAVYRLSLGAAGFLISMLPFLWVMILMWLAVQVSFQLKGWQMFFLVAVIPPLLMAVQIFWSTAVLMSAFHLLVLK